MTNKERALLFVICLLGATLFTQMIKSNTRVKELRKELWRCQNERN